ncbi:MAG: M56 family metallopeptidase, partial [Planctomycetota bacterium]
MNQIGIALVWCVIQVTAIGLVTVGLYALLRRAGPAARSLVAQTSLSVVVALSVLALSPWPQWSLFAGHDPAESVPQEGGSSRGTDVRAAAGSLPTEPVSAPSTAKVLADSAEGEPSAIAALWQGFLGEVSRAPTGPDPARWRWPAVVTVSLLVVAGLGLIRLLAGALIVSSYRRASRPVQDRALLELVDVLRAELGCRRKIEIRESHNLTTAAAVGWRRPLVLLPADWNRWTDEQRRAVLAHEIAHVRRNDFLGSVWGQLGLALHFYHPMMHWLNGRLRLEQELAADAAAASLTGGRRSYLRTIAEMALAQADRPMGWPARAFLPGRTTFLRRIAMLRSDQPTKGSLSRVGSLLVIVLLVTCGALVAGLRSPAGAAAPEVDAASGRSAPDTIDWSYVPSDAHWVIAVRPAALFGQADREELGGVRPGLDALREFVNDSVPALGVSLEKIEQITFLSLDPPRPGSRISPPAPKETLILRATEPADFADLIRRYAPAAYERTIDGQTYFRGGGELPFCYFRPDDRTILIDVEPNLKRMIRAGQREKAPAGP